MHHTGRISFFFVLLSLFFGITCYSQIIEKAPPSPVTVTVVKPNSVNSVVTITNIVVTGYKRTKSYIIEREIPFQKGEKLYFADLRDRLSLCKQRLMNTTLFVDVDITPIFVDTADVAVKINVKERWYLFPLPYFNIVTRNFNTWWVQEKHSLQRVNYGVKFMQNNVSGRNDNLNIWVVGGYTQQLSLRYENPAVNKKLTQGFNVGLGYSRNRELNYAIDYNKQSFYKQDDRFIIKQLYADFAYSYRPAIKTRHTLKVSYHDIGVNDSVVKLNPRFFAAPVKRVQYGDISYNLSYTNLDYNPYPLHGFAGDVTLYKRFGKNSNFWQLDGSVNHVIKVLPKSYLQLQAAGLFRLPFSQPYISNSLMGSASLYMRGLEYYVVEGSAGGVVRGTIKNQVLSFNVRNLIRAKRMTKYLFVYF